MNYTTMDSIYNVLTLWLLIGVVLLNLKLKANIEYLDAKIKLLNLMVGINEDDRRRQTNYRRV